MPVRKFTTFLLIALGCMMLAGAALFYATQPASAQCGSQASSCKTCHEVQGEMSVNADGTGWHVSHAFGDFCYICHAGNNQATNKDEAHTGMVAPLSDPKASCMSCHPNDLQARVDVYAAKLGGTGSAPAATEAPAAAEPAATEAPAAAGTTDSTSSGSTAPTGGDGSIFEPDTNAAEVVDMNKAGAVKPINVGNIILITLIIAVVLGGGGFVIWNERRLRGSSPAPQAPAAAKAIVPEIPGYDKEVAELVPMIAQLNPVGRHALKKLLSNPANADEMLHSLSRLDPELVRRIRSLDRDTRSMLLALSGE